MAHKEKSNFKYGFSIEGFSASTVGTDLIATYKSKASWNKDEDGEKEVGTPIQIDYENGRELKVCADGEVPHGFLEVRVGKKLTDREIDFGTRGLYPVAEVRPGDPVTFVKFVDYAILETSLLADDYEPAVGDSVYVEDGLYTGTAPTDGVAIGTVIETGEEDGYIEILLEKE